MVILKHKKGSMNTNQIHEIVNLSLGAGVCISFRKCNYSYCLFLQNYNRFKSCKVSVTPNN